MEFFFSRYGILIQNYLAMEMYFWRSQNEYQGKVWLSSCLIKHHAKRMRNFTAFLTLAPDGAVKLANTVFLLY
jgi:hypothetical protein